MIGPIRGVMLIGIFAMLGCSDGAKPAEVLATATPVANQESLDNCAVWSCSWGDCSWDPGVYGPCCVEITEPGQPGRPKGSCGGSPYPGGGGSCGPSTYGSGEIWGAGCYCPVEYACCYWQNPSNLDPASCNGGPA